MVEEHYQFFNLVLVAFERTLTLFHMGYFQPSVMGGGGGIRAPHHNFVVIAPIIMKVGTDIKLDVFYTMVTKNLWRHYYYVIMTS